MKRVKVICGDCYVGNPSASDSQVVTALSANVEAGTGWLTVSSDLRAAA